MNRKSILLINFFEAPLSMRSNKPVTGEAIVKEVTQSKIVNSIDLRFINNML